MPIPLMPAAILLMFCGLILGCAGNPVNSDQILGCAENPVKNGPGAPPPASSGLDAALWAQSSAEYAASARQCYNAATRMLEAALADTGWSAAPEQASGAKAGFAHLPPAVILDVDETVLDNTAFNARLIMENRPFDPALWAEWVARESAPGVPGAAAFIRAAAARGVTVFFITNRRCDGPGEDCPQQAHTIANLAQIGVPDVAPSAVLMRDERPDWGGEKTTRRSAVARSHRILLIIGDDLADFMDGVRKGTSAEQRRQMAEARSDWWGSRWFILPNPMYGSWMSPLEGKGPNGKMEALKGFNK